MLAGQLPPVFVAMKPDSINNTSGQFSHICGNKTGHFFLKTDQMHWQQQNWIFLEETLGLFTDVFYSNKPDNFDMTLGRFPAMTVAKILILCQ